MALSLEDLKKRKRSNPVLSNRANGRGGDSKEMAMPWDVYVCDGAKKGTGPDGDRSRGEYGIAGFERDTGQGLDARLGKDGPSEGVAENKVRKGDKASAHEERMVLEGPGLGPNPASEGAGLGPNPASEGAGLGPNPASEAPRHRDNIGTEAPRHRDNIGTEAPRHRDNIGTEAPRHRDNIGTEAPRHRDNIGTEAPRHRDNIGTEAPRHRDNIGTEAPRHRDNIGTEGRGHRDNIGTEGRGHRDNIGTEGRGHRDNIGTEGRGHRDNIGTEGRGHRDNIGTEGRGHRDNIGTEGRGHRDNIGTEGRGHRDNIGTEGRGHRDNIGTEKPEKTVDRGARKGVIPRSSGTQKILIFLAQIADPETSKTPFIGTPYIASKCLVTIMTARKSIQRLKSGKAIRAMESHRSPLAGGAVYLVSRWAIKKMQDEGVLPFPTSRADEPKRAKNEQIATLVSQLLMSS